jgi:energy-converting hydrogenase Eha subunit B
VLLSVVEGLAISFPEIFVGERLCSDTMLLSVVEGLAISVSEIFVGERLGAATMLVSLVEGMVISFSEIFVERTRCLRNQSSKFGDGSPLL